MDVTGKSTRARRGAVAAVAAVGAAGLVAGGLAGCATPPVASSAAAALGGVDQPVNPPAPTSTSTTTAPPAPKPTPKPKPVVPRKRLGITSITPGGKGPYGVAMVITVDFDHALDRKAKRALQKRMTVTTTKRIGSASWAWIDSDTAMFRPKNFWPANAKVTVSVRMQGLTLSKNSQGYRLFGRGIKTRTFTIGRAQVTSIDGNTQMGVVKRNGKAIRTIAVSMGKEGWRTRNGIKAFMDRELDHVYTNTAVGDFSESYRLVARYNLRLTWSGEFLHSAPWAYGRLGAYPGSHGCTNAYDWDAGWFYDTALEGDPVIYKNTGGPTMELGNGLGGPWNIGWKQWRAWSSGGMSGTFKPA